MFGFLRREGRGTSDRAQTQTSQNGVKPPYSKNRLSLLSFSPSEERSRLMRLAGAFVAWACCLPAAPAQDWPRFRGPNGDGLGEVKGFSPRWTEKDYAWKVKLPGVGH